MITLLDTVTPGAIGRIASTSSDAVAGYDDGRYNDIAALEKAYPNHHHLSISVFPEDDGDCLDIETGDARPEDAPGWLRRQHARGLARPWLYANRSTWPAVTAALVEAGVHRNSYIKWVASYDGQAVLEEDDDAHQWTDRWRNSNVDASVCKDDVFALPKPPPKPRKQPRPGRKAKKPRKPIHKKVIGAAGGGVTATGVIALMHALGVTITPAEAAGAAAVLGPLVGYLTPSP